MSTAAAIDKRSRQTGWVVLAIVAGNLLIDTVEVSSFFVALPTLTSHFAMSTTEILVLCAAFPAAFAVGIPLARPLAARVGTQRLFVVALIAFAVVSIGAAAANSVAMIALARVIKGLAAGLTTPLGNTVIGAAFASETERGRASKLYSLIGGAGFFGGMAVTAPLVMATWRAGISWTGPVAALLAVAAIALLPRRIVAPEEDSSVSVTMGVVLASSAVATAVAVAPVDERLRLSAVIVAIVSVVVGTGMGATTALLPGTTRQFVANALTAGMFNALFLAFFATAQLLLQRNGHSAISASLVLSPVALGMACATPLAGWVSRVLPASRAITFAVALCAVAYAWFGVAGSGGRSPGVGDLLGIAALVGMAFVLGFVALNMRAVSLASPTRRGGALSWYQILVQSGAALSIPVMASVATISDREPVDGWPPVVAVGGLGMLCITVGTVIAGRELTTRRRDGQGI